MNKVYQTISKAIFFAAFTFLAFNVSAQTGSLRGKVFEETGGKKTPLPDVTIIAQLGGITKATAYSDDNGFYDIKSLPAGNYTIIFFLQGYQKLELQGVTISDDQITELKSTSVQKLSKELKEVEIRRLPGDPLKSASLQGKRNGEQVQNAKITNINNVVKTFAGVNTKNGANPSFLGSRANQTGYFVNGTKAIGSIPLIPDALNDVTVITGGVPAQYGDFTGGAINITFKAPTKYFVNVLDYSNSMLFDRYNYQNLSGYFSGPLKIINKQDPGKERVILGYTLGFAAVRQRDPFPSAIPIYKVKDEKLAELEKKPIAPNPTGDGFIPSASYITKSDLEPIKYRLNSMSQSIAYISTLTYNPTKNMNVQFGLNGQWASGYNYSFTSSLFNYKYNTLSTGYTNRFFLNMTHKLKSWGDKKEDDKKADKSLITDALYTIRLDYTNVYGRTEDPEHKGNLWNYGYVGKFTTYKQAAFGYFDQGVNNPRRMFIDQKGDTVYLRNSFEQVGYSDTALRFERSELNPVKANYTQQVYDQYGNLIHNSVAVQALGGLMNGDAPSSVYGMWANVGTNASGYGKSNSDQYTLTAIGEASITPDINNREKKHDLQFGISYEQRVQRGYSIGAAGLWSRATSLANQAVLELDKSHPILAYDAEGVFQDTIYYNRLYNPNDENEFARNIRDYLMSKQAKDVNGNAIQKNSWVDVNSMDPSEMKLDWFSADDLYNNGNQYIDVYGYDYKGNVIKGRPSIKDWNESRKIGAFAPINAAAWVQDQFSYQDIKFRLGLRAEQFDANIKVLRDPYLLFPAHTAAEWKNKNQIPGTIGNDYVVYVDNYKSASPNIVGFRNGNTWYNKQGNVLADPTVLAQAGGRIQPWLVRNDINLSKYDLDPEAFEDYKPTPIFMPRIWFSFPISTDAEFFANYDVLSQRPVEGFFATPDDYQYFERRALDGTLNNPNVRPSRKTSYEVGYKQKLSKISAISFIASYAETKDLIQLKRFVGAFPTSYTAFGNEDFSTSKAFRIEYLLSGFKHIDLIANYTLLFADGTGSSATTSGGLVAVGKPSLKTLQPLDVDYRHTVKVGIDYRYKSAKEEDYDGPVVKMFGKERNILESFGMNLQIQGFSGAPYTATSNKNVSQVIGGAVARNPIQGTINGQRLPGQAYVDLTLDKTFTIKYKDKDDQKKQMFLNVYLACTNMLNTKNVLGVYSNTGLPDDDGYLTSPDGIKRANSESNRQAFVDQYQIRANNPSLYALPRQIRLGVRVIMNGEKSLVN
jgi:hypothetical protein